MSTLIAVYTSEGCIGRCDARCHDAHEPDCDCICAGRNHGAGREQAIINTQQHAEAWLTRIANRRGLDRDRVVALVGADVGQEVLF
jgi:hypothetical protein